MGFRLPPGPVDARLHEVLEKVPEGAGNTGNRRVKKRRPEFHPDHDLAYR